MKLKTTQFEPLEDYDGWYVSTGKPVDSEKAEARALSLQNDALAKGYYCVAGIVEDEYGLYLVPRKGVRYVIETFEVGSHAGAKADGVYDEVRRADAINPLIPYFADEAGIKATFEKPVTGELLAVLEEDLYSVEAMMTEDEGTIDDYIRVNNGIHLWWD